MWLILEDNQRLLLGFYGGVSVLGASVRWPLISFKEAAWLGFFLVGAGLVVGVGDLDWFG